MNATSLRAFDQLSAAAGEALWPSSVTIASVAYTCAVVRPRESSILSAASDDPAPVTLPVRIRKDLLPTAPAENSYLTWESARWKIRSIRGQDACDAAWTLYCEPAP
jgi:hypothetical protein